MKGAAKPDWVDTGEPDDKPKVPDPDAAPDDEIEADAGTPAARRDGGRAGAGGTGAMRDAGSPTDADEPDAADEPDEPGEPGEPDEPDEPGEPGESDEPDEPDQPDEPNQSDEPDEPDAPVVEGRCDLPACAPPELRSCYGSGECRVDYGRDADARVCFDNGIEFRSRRGAAGDRITILRVDGSTCFSVGLTTDSSSGGVGAVYLNAEGERIAVAGLQGSTWAFVCDNGSTKLLNGFECGLFADLPPGIANVDDCRDGSCE